MIDGKWLSFVMNEAYDPQAGPKCKPSQIGHPLKTDFKRHQAELMPFDVGYTYPAVGHHAGGSRIRSASEAFIDRVKRQPRAGTG